MYKICIAVVSLLVPLFVSAGGDFLGVNTHIGQRWQRIEPTKFYVQHLRFSSFRDEVYWSRVETRPGVLTYPAEVDELVKLAKIAKERGGRLVVVLGYGNQFYDGGRHPRSAAAREAFEKYCEFIAKAFSGSAVIFEIWNEWNSEIGVRAGSGNGSVEDYLEVLRKVAPVVRAAAPDALIISTGVARGVDQIDWLRRFAEQGGGEMVDGLGVHTYIFNKRGWTPTALDTLLTKLAGENSELGKVISEKGFYITEFGTPDDEKNIIAGSGSLADGLTVLIQNPFVKGVWVYQLIDNKPKFYENGSFESKFGLFDHYGRPKKNVDEVIELINRHSYSK